MATSRSSPTPSIIGATSARDHRRWRWGILFSLPLLGLCTLCAAIVAASAFLSPADARPPFPNSELISDKREWDLRGLHTARTYRAPTDIRTTLEWYYNEGLVPRFARNNPNLQCADHRFLAPVPDLPVPLWVYSRFSDALFCTDGKTTTVTVKTYYYWRYVEP